jgi:DNA-binding CsgD family transcriptional regulator
MVSLRITPRMFEILKLRLQGDTGYKIARKLRIDPPEAYRTLKIAHANFSEAAKMLEELKKLGWPGRLVKVQTANQALKARRISREEEPEASVRSDEIPIKLG